MASSNRNNQQIFDEIRGIWVKATPEEVLRQSILRKMTRELGYPRELIAVEKEIGELVSGGASPPPQRRIDILCFTQSQQFGLRPLFLIECKDEPLSQKAIDQVVGYNAFIKAPYLCVVTPEGEMTGYWDPISQSYRFQRGFPGYLELLECVKLSFAAF
jgi:hypothetical protein